ncbi:hypothetical protein [Pseudoduganella sp. R-43]|jgi:hypothetical protein|uniref:hypothetical protein n=1 Tax=unclassified Pseudoduganella TaxID=2637179 RepID=UPI003CF30F1F
MNILMQGTKAATAGAMLALLNGCAGFQLYDEARDKQGQAVVKAWGEVKAENYFDSVRKVRAADEVQAREYRKAKLMFERDSSFQPVLDLPLDKGLAANIDHRLLELAGPASADYAVLDRKVRNIMDAIGIERVSQEFFQRSLLERHFAADCTSALAGELRARLEKAREFGLLLEAEGLRASCQQEQEASARLDQALAGTGGELKKQQDALQALRKQLVFEAGQARQAEQAFKLAQEEYRLAAERAAQFAARPLPGDELQKSAASLHDAIAVLQKLETAAGKEALARTSLSTIDDILASVSGDKAPAADDGKLESAARMFPALANDLHQLRAVRGTNVMPSLQIAKAIASSRSDTAHKMLALQAQRLEYLDQARLAAYGEFASLLAARGALPGLNGPQRKLSFAQLWDKFPAHRHALAKSAIDYQTAIGARHLATSDLLAAAETVRNEGPLVRAEGNFGEWSSLITPTVDEAARFAANGQKPDLVLNLVKAISLLWIGVEQ